MKVIFPLTVHPAWRALALVYRVALRHYNAPEPKGYDEGNYTWWYARRHMAREIILIASKARRHHRPRKDMVKP